MQSSSLKIHAIACEILKRGDQTCDVGLGPQLTFVGGHLCWI